MFLVYAAGLFGQTQFPINTTINVIDPSPFIEDYTQDGRLVITILSTDERPVYQARMRITISSGTFTLATDPMMTPPVTLFRDQMVMLTGPQLAPYLSLNNVQPLGTGRDDLLNNGNQLPDGPVVICVELFDPNFLDAPPVNNPTCGFGTMQVNQPPLLVPLPQENTTETTPQAINFTWIPQQTFPAEYTLEIWENSIDFGDNFIINNLAPLINIQTIEIQYPLTDFDPLLTPGKEYIYRVRAEDIAGRQRFINDGYSEIGRFTYYPAASSNCYTPRLEEASGGDGRIPIYFSWNAEPVAQELPHRLKVYRIATDELLSEQDLPAGTFSTNARGDNPQLSQLIPEVDTLGGSIRIELCVQCPDGADEACTAFTYGSIIDQSLDEDLEEEVVACGESEITELNAAEIGRDFADLLWNEPVGYQVENYTFQYRIEDGTAPYSQPITISETNYLLTDLQAATNYEAQVCFTCEDLTPNCASIIFTTTPLSCAEAGFEPLGYECGADGVVVQESGVPLIDVLSPGDSVWAGDFLVEILEVSGGPSFAGSGRMIVPYLNEALITVTFDAISVNANCRMVAGEMVVASPYKELLEDLNDLVGDWVDNLNQIGQSLDQLSDALGQIEDLAEDWEEMHSVLDALANAENNVPYFPQEVLDQLQAAADSLESKPLTDKGDAQEQIQEALDAYQEALADLFNADFQVPFVKHEGMEYGYDILTY
ncbi:MAG: fibronectin type III domain-containing protein, partial [Bacteroidota bacterium]